MYEPFTDDELEEKYRGQMDDTSDPQYAYYYGTNHPGGLTIEDPVWLEKLAYALFADVEEGLIRPNKSEYTGDLTLEFEYGGGMHGSQYIPLDYQAKNTLACLREYEEWAKEINEIIP